MTYIESAAKDTVENAAFQADEDTRDDFWAEQAQNEYETIAYANR